MNLFLRLLLHPLFGDPPDPLSGRYGDFRSFDALYEPVLDQGSEVNSPRQAFKAAFKLGWIKDELIWDQIIRERNLAVHTYSQELAETVYAEIPKLKCAFIDLRENLQKVYPFV